MSDSQQGRVTVTIDGKRTQVPAIRENLVNPANGKVIDTRLVPVLPRRVVEVTDMRSPHQAFVSTGE
ncbi:hypothetical protein [Pseudomonas nitroreducens]|uniref:hypothetical protein n=1 Tax=Pseudomonas nitroreducens TaxID=46680 RepID=UPI0026591677|nr:hypothetical protein [Pseudomonas nitroreducens]MCP1646979.1 hypothetical protein [Pseudomonas nitroreducens]MCP1685555.1 hypothetical protein [Pseudomonas nitroreducens]